VYYAVGQGVEKDAVEAVKWYRKAAERNIAQAQFNLAVCYEEGKGVKEDAVEAVKWYRKAAEQNYPDAQNNLASCYSSGQGVAKDMVEAVKWYRKAAEQDCADAQSSLGACYATGQGVERDDAEAVKWFRKAAMRNSHPGQYNLGVCYQDGQGEPKDETEAYKWFLLAAAQGNQGAKQDATKLERRLTSGQRAAGQQRASEFTPPEISLDRASQIEADGNPLTDLRTKAETGDAESQNQLGEAFYAGKRGLPKDPVEAMKWFRKAAGQNHPAAQYNLAVGYERGDGVAKYEVEAYKWYRLAAKQGDRKAQRYATMLELTMSRDEIEEGKRRESTWLDQRKAPPPKAAMPKPRANWPMPTSWAVLAWQRMRSRR
jgi:TPR repeat protein